MATIEALRQEKIQEIRADVVYAIARRAVEDSPLGNRQFWDIIFQKADRAILWETFSKLDDRMTCYYPFLLELYPTAETRPWPQAALIELYRKGKIAEAFRAFKKIYSEVVDQLIDHLKGQESSDSSRRVG